MRRTRGGSEEEDGEEDGEEDRSQDREAHSVRACAVEMHTDIFKRASLYGNLRAAGTSGDIVLCKPAQSKGDISQAPFCAEIYRANAARVAHNEHFCASVRGQNAHGHVTRAILRGDLQGKSRTPRIPSRLNTGPELLP